MAKSSGAVEQASSGFMGMLLVLVGVVSIAAGLMFGIMLVAGGSFQLTVCIKAILLILGGSAVLVWGLRTGRSAVQPQ